MKYDLAIFDLDGTIIDSMGIWQDMASRWFLKHGLQVPVDMEAKLFSMTFLDSAQYCLSFISTDTTPEELLAQWTEDALESYKKDIQLKPYTVEILTRIKAMGMQISLTTSNFREVAVDIIQRLGIDQYFDSVTVTQEVDRSKYYPDVYLLAASRHRISPNRCVVFEDSYYSIHGAKEAGMYVIGVYDYYSKHFKQAIEAIADRYVMSLENIYRDHKFFMNE